MKILPTQIKIFPEFWRATFCTVVKTALHVMSPLVFSEFFLQTTALFNVNLALRAKQLNFWHNLFIKLVLAEFYVSGRPLKNFRKKRSIFRWWLNKTFSEFCKRFLGVLETEVKLSRRYLAGTKIWICKKLFDSHFPFFWGRFLKVLAEDLRRSCYLCFLQVQRKDLRKTICFK